MVSIKTFLATSVALVAAFVNVEAAVSPSYPQPGAIQPEGQAFDITWIFDGKNPDVTYTIDFMTGSNDQQVFLANVAKNVKPTLLKYNFVAPKVSPYAAVYFFMFTGSDGVASWTTRFGISGPDGKLVAEPESTQPNGDKIPWGVGKLLSGGDAAAGNSSSSAVPSVSASSSPVPAAVSPASSPIAVSGNTDSSNTVPTPAAEPAAKPAAAADAASSVVPPVAQIASKADSAGAIIKPALGFVSAAAIGYLAL